MGNSSTALFPPICVPDSSMYTEFRWFTRNMQCDSRLVAADEADGPSESEESVYGLDELAVLSDASEVLLGFRGRC